jgi:hypothetical protein
MAKWRCEFRNFVGECEGKRSLRRDKNINGRVILKCSLRK